VGGCEPVRAWVPVDLWITSLLPTGPPSAPRTPPADAGCGQSGAGYDRLPARRFEFVPFWGMKVFLVYAQRRVECTRCGVRVEEMPWAEGKHSVTQAYAWFDGLEVALYHTLGALPEPKFTTDFPEEAFIISSMGRGATQGSPMVFPVRLLSCTGNTG